MIPVMDNPINDDLDTVQQPSATWKLDFEKGKVVGKIDELEAVKQAVFKILHTDRYWHVIYSTDYGHELSTLIGSHPIYLQSELRRRVEEALLTDERIVSVNDLGVEMLEDQIKLSFQVNSIHGAFNEEVNKDV
jgi:phage baseplate assembly protein W